MRFFATVAAVLLALSATPAHAWWDYAKWGLTEAQLIAASKGRVQPCEPRHRTCAKLLDGYKPALYVDNLDVSGMPASASFGFDAQGRLNQTIVLLPDARFARVADILSAIYGAPIDDRPGGFPVRVWRDAKKATTITAVGADPVVRVVYQPASGL